MKIHPLVLALVLSSPLALPTSSPGIQGSPEFQINTIEGIPEEAHVAFGATGNFVVTWHSYLGYDSRILARPYDRTASPLGDEFQVNSANPEHLSSPHVALAADGSFVVVWLGMAGPGGWTIFAQRFDSAGAPLGNELVLGTGPTSPRLELTSDSVGNFVLFWEATVGGGTDLFARRFDPHGNPLGDEFRINSPTSDDERSPVAASDAAGNFVVVWSGPHGSDRRLLARRYDATGQALGGEVQITTSSGTSHDYGHAVTRDTDGDFVVVWKAQAGGISGQRYDHLGQHPSALARIEPPVLAKIEPPPP